MGQRAGGMSVPPGLPPPLGGSREETNLFIDSATENVEEGTVLSVTNKTCLLARGRMRSV
jgi:hypothetical protein